MSGTRRLINGSIAQGKLRGRALSDALASQLNAEDKADVVIKKKIYAQHPKKK